MPCTKRGSFLKPKPHIMKTMRNFVQLIDNIGADPEIRTYGENKLARLSLATNEQYVNDRGERVNETQWHNLIAWGKNAEFVEKFVHKGQGLVINGKLQQRSYDKGGERRYVTEVLINEFFLTASNED